jgi:hypothetical protein
LSAIIVKFGIDWGTATVRWNKIMTGKVTTIAADLRRELLRYCALDTQAMVDIWRVLARTTDPVSTLSKIIAEPPE